MPYKSQAQAAKFHILEKQGKISPSVVQEFDQATDFSSLPRRAAKSTRDMAGLAKQSGFNMVASNLTNLAERRETDADFTEAKIKRTRPVRKPNGPSRP